MGTVDPGALGPTHILAIGAALVTAAIHLAMGIQDLTGGFGISFLIATAGFLAGIWAILTGYRRRLVYAIGIPFTGGQIVLWYVFNQPIPPVSTIELVDKTAQAVLVVLLVYLLYAESS